MAAPSAFVRRLDEHLRASFLGLEVHRIPADSHPAWTIRNVGAIQGYARVWILGRHHLITDGTDAGTFVEPLRDDEFSVNVVERGAPTRDWWTVRVSWTVNTWDAKIEAITERAFNVVYPLVMSKPGFGVLKRRDATPAF